MAGNEPTAEIKLRLRRQRQRCTGTYSERVQRSAAPRADGTYAPEYSVVQAILDENLDVIDLEAPEAADLKLKDDIILDSCRRCSDVFQYTWIRHTTKVIIGVPKILKYKVASYI